MDNDDDNLIERRRIVVRTAIQEKRDFQSLMGYLSIGCY
jgi:hypothetical protein